MNWKFIGNGRIKDPEGLVWFIDGFFVDNDDLHPLNLGDREYPTLKTRQFLRIFRFTYPIDYYSTGIRRRKEDIEVDFKAFNQIEYFGKDHPLAGQIKSIIFKEDYDE